MSGTPSPVCAEVGTSETDLCLFETGLEFVADGLALKGQTVLESVIGDLLPAVQTIDLVEGDNEGSFAVSQHLHGLEGLGFETVHDIDDQNGNVTERGSTRSEVREGLVTRGIDNEKTRNLEVELAIGVDNRRLLSNGLNREVCGTDLLCNTTSFAFLDVGLSDLVQKLGLSGIDVTENTANRGSQVVRGSSSQSSLVGFLATFSRLSLSLLLSQLSGCGGLHKAYHLLGAALLSPCVCGLRLLLSLLTSLSGSDLDTSSQHLLKLSLVSRLLLLLGLCHVLALFLELLDTLLVFLLLESPGLLTTLLFLCSQTILLLGVGPSLGVSLSGFFSLTLELLLLLLELGKMRRELLFLASRIGGWGGHFRSGLLLHLRGSNLLGLSLGSSSRGTSLLLGGGLL
ncbi:hypothetical protein HG530_000026 [Fusarium avenaceum]|nr:hypothetical protein HG530_000026 [Fusarium avenaceum]